MNWFQRHLNLTALGIALLSAGIYIFLVKISLGFNSIDLRNTLNLGFPVIFLLFLYTIAWLALSSIGYGWILYRKNRSPLFLIVFLPAFATVVGCIVYKTFYMSGIDSGHDIVCGGLYEEQYSPFPYQIFYLNIILLIIGWLLLLTLNNRNKPEKTNDNQIVPIKTTRPHLLHYLYGFSSRLKYTVISISALTIIIPIVTCLYINYGYITYHLPESASKEFPDFSFEYPANHYEPIYHQYNYICGQNQTTVKEVSFWRTPLTSVASMFYITSYNQTIEASWGGFDIYKDHILGSFETPRDKFQFDYSLVMVGNIPAHQLIVNFGIRMGSNDSGTDIYVFFDYNGYSWFISWFSLNTETLQPPTFFTHLLETLKIYDN